MSEDIKAEDKEKLAGFVERLRHACQRWTKDKTWTGCQPPTEMANWGDQVIDVHFIDALEDCATEIEEAIAE